METKIKNMTVEELKELIQETVQDAMDGYLEDLEALSSRSFRESIKEARAEYQNGKYEELEDVLDE